MWAEDYIGIPFKNNGTDRTGLDCYRLAVMVYRDRLNIDLPCLSDVFMDGTMATLKKAVKSISEVKKLWTEVKKPRPLDVILIRTGNLTYHIGIVINRCQMLHVMEGINSTIEEFTGLQWRKKIEGFYRYPE